MNTTTPAARRRYCTLYRIGYWCSLAILAGMRGERADPESEIEGRQALFVVNLEPRSMAGQVSEGCYSTWATRTDWYPFLLSRRNPCRTVAVQDEQTDRRRLDGNSIRTRDDAAMKVRPVNFNSDNVAGASPEILAALVAANHGAVASYGDDPITSRLEARFRDLFERDVAVFPVGTGTAANALCLAACMPPWGVTYCHRAAHIACDECGAPEFYSGGGKLALLDGAHARLAPEALSDALASGGPARCITPSPPRSVSARRPNGYSLPPSDRQDRRDRAHQRLQAACRRSALCECPGDSGLQRGRGDLARRR